MWAALAYGMLGEPAKAREVLNQHEARLDSLTRMQEFVFEARVRGEIPFGEGKVDSAVAWFRLGELYENANDAKRATEYYGRFVDLGAKADPELQPRVADARKRIDQLNRATR